MLKNNVITMVAVAGIVNLTAVVPVTPGNIGCTEWIADALYRNMGMEGGATVFMLWWVLLLLFSLAGEIFYLRIGAVQEQS